MTGSSLPRLWNTPKMQSVPASALRATMPAWRRLRVACAAAGLCLLSACAGYDPLVGFNPPNPEVKPIATDQFPSIGVTPSDTRNPLTTEGQQKLQRDLEGAAKRQGAVVRQAN